MDNRTNTIAEIEATLAESGETLESCAYLLAYLLGATLAQITEVYDQDAIEVVQRIVDSAYRFNITQNTQTDNPAQNAVCH